MAHVQVPSAAADVRPEGIEVASALVFLDEPELAWYRKRTTSAA